MFYKKILYYLKLALPLTLLFIMVYGSANWFNSLRAEHYNFYSERELVIPFIPEMILVYFSIQILFLLPIIHCNKIEMNVLAKRMALAILIAGTIFLLFPTRTGFVRSDSIESFQLLFVTLYSLDMQHNLFPSLHITLSTLVVTTLFNNINTFTKIFYLAWLGTLYLSVLLIHQHHVADIIGGILLTFLCVWLLPNPEKKQSFKNLL